MAKNGNGKSGPKFGVMKLEDMLPPKRFGREVIEGTELWRDFLANVGNIGTREGWGIEGVTKSKAQGYRKRIDAYIKEQKLPLKTRIVTREDGTQDVYVYDNQLDLG